MIARNTKTITPKTTTNNLSFVRNQRNNLTTKNTLTTTTTTTILTRRFHSYNNENPLVSVGNTNLMNKEFINHNSKFINHHNKNNTSQLSSTRQQIHRRYSSTSSNFQRPSQWTSSNTELLEKDMMPNIQDYLKDRDSYYKMRAEMKKIRRVDIGPLATLTWENYDMLWMQVHEMVAIETGDPSQYAEEIEAYQSLVPKGNNLIGTLMFEISNREQREKKLKELGYVEDTVYLVFGSHEVQAAPLSSDRTAPDGKTSAIHFMTFDFSPEQKEMFLRSIESNEEVKLEIRHSKYPHATRLSPELLDALRNDLHTG